MNIEEFCNTYWFIPMQAIKAGVECIKIELPHPLKNIRIPMPGLDTSGNKLTGLTIQEGNIKLLTGCEKIWSFKMGNFYSVWVVFALIEEYNLVGHIKWREQSVEDMYNEYYNDPYRKIVVSATIKPIDEEDITEEDILEEDITEEDIIEEDILEEEIIEEEILDDAQVFENIARRRGI